MRLYFCQHTHTHLHVRMEEKELFFFTDGASMHPHLGQRTLLLCVLKVNCPAVMGIGRQSGINWHEWAWLQALCGWRTGRRLLSVCPCRWIMCSTFSKAHKQKCQTGSSIGWACRLAQFIKGLRCTTQTHIQNPWDRHVVHNGAIQNSAVTETNKFKTHTHTLHRCLHAP